MPRHMIFPSQVLWDPTESPDPPGTPSTRNPGASESVLVATETSSDGPTGQGTRGTLGEGTVPTSEVSVGRRSV